MFPHFLFQPKQIKEIKDFLLTARRKDASGEGPSLLKILRPSMIKVSDV
jgi:hypothetical protein